MPQYFDIILPPALMPVAVSPPTPSQKVVPPQTFAAPAALKPKHMARFGLLSSLGLLIGVTILVIGLFAKHPDITPTSAAAAPSANNSASLTAAGVSETKQSPLRLNIPSIGVDATIQEVGLTSEGGMGLPSNYTDVGWYKLGTRIGQPGNAVLAGHLSSQNNGPAVFGNLHQLKSGEFIYVKDKDKQQRFRVISSQSYDVSQAPYDKIFGSTDKTHLNLITCSGSWDKTKKEYNQRLVVFTELVR